MKIILAVVVLCLISSAALKAQDQIGSDKMVDKILAREKNVRETLQKFSPIAETYLQLQTPKDEGFVLSGDRYFLGEVHFGQDVYVNDFKLRGSVILHYMQMTREAALKINGVDYLADGFAATVYPDPETFNRANYRFVYLKREFLGEVRCVVFEVSPLDKHRSGTFSGRIWVEDQDDTIVRFNGTFLNTFADKLAGDYYFHFDSWRVNTGPGLWLPALIYSEETNLPCCGLPKLPLRHIRFKAQTRFWGYKTQYPGSEQELAQIVIDPAVIADQSSLQQLSPIQAQHAWERQAEDNVLDQLEKVGLLAPAGEAEKTLSTVVNNLEITNNLEIEPEVRCRVLLTSKLEVFMVGHTIVVSRGLIDVLPDEATLAAILADGLAHIVSGKGEDTQFAFADRVMFEPRDTFRRMQFAQSGKEEERVSAKAVDFLRNSPYKDSLASVYDFFAILRTRSGTIPSLLKPSFGDNLLLEFAAFKSQSPEISKGSAALPLGSRVWVDPWRGQINLIKTKNVVSNQKSDLKPFEVTPFMPYLRWRSLSSASIPASEQPYVSFATPTP
jgi:hypothetical protein